MCAVNEALHPRRSRMLSLVALSGTTVAAVGTAHAADTTAAGKFAAEVLAEGLVFTHAIAFVKGLGAVVNPCVYPLIPITLSLIGARGARSKREAFSHAGLYVLGMALMYTGLGVAAAALGKLFGFTFQSGWVMGFVVGVFFAMALSMFGVFELRLPLQWTDRLMAGRGEIARVLLMGMFSGVVAAPCTAPFVFSLLAYVSETQDLVLGASTLFVFSLGLGLPFLFLGGFSGAISRLPKSGPWLVAVKYLFGLTLLGLAAYYLTFAVGRLWAPILAGAMLVLLGAGAIRLKLVRDWTDRAFRVGGAMVLLAGLATYSVGLARAAGGDDPKGAIAWLDDEAAAVARARAGAKPIMLDFWATWCAGCKELEADVLSAGEVTREARRFVAARIDCSKETPTVRALYKKYAVQGLPAIVFIDTAGRIAHDATVTEVIAVEDFLERMRKIR